MRGVALLDFDRDGDLDIYVTNGPGAPNSLFANRLRETGEMRFVDVAEAAGVAASDHDSTGVCFGDLDNDGDPELVVLSHNAPPRLFKNLSRESPAGGEFLDVTLSSGLADGPVGVASSCSLGDVDGDGLLDLAIANTYADWSHSRAIRSEPFMFNQHNRLWHNRGDLTFVDATSPAGVDRLAGFPKEHADAAGVTWAIALVDLDLDGDVDLLSADDQAEIPTSMSTGGFDRGYIHLLRNDGTGRFEDVTPHVGLDIPGAWMGLAFGDLDADGRMDLFATNFGDYVPFRQSEPGRQASRWLLQQADGTFTDPGVGDLVTTPFGWGAAVADLDNDGDLDITYHGGLDVGPGIEASNGGVLLRNRGDARFDADLAAFSRSGIDHRRRAVQGMAVGDLDRNGLLDVVSVSSFDLPRSVELQSYPPLGSPFDRRATFVSLFEVDPVDETPRWVDTPLEPGGLVVELASADGAPGRNHVVEVRTLGTVGLTSRGRVNRDGIGAVVRFRSAASPGEGLLLPVLGGSSYASQHALALTFGLGREMHGVVEVLWPGGARNRLAPVWAGERIVLPEIPCGYDDASLSALGYVRCVEQSLGELEAAGVLSRGWNHRLFWSAIQARFGPR